MNNVDALHEAIDLAVQAHLLNGGRMEHACDVLGGTISAMLCRAEGVGADERRKIVKPARDAFDAFCGKVRTEAKRLKAMKVQSN
jgi:hypothetical protein